MFTGIVRHVGRVERVVSTRSGRRLRIELGPLANDLDPGDSVAANGACLTVASVDGGTGEFDVVTETLTRTTLGDLTSGSRVNLEPALRLSDALDGHMVQGHVDGQATVTEVRSQGAWEIAFACSRKLTDQMVPKGSICVDGVSLTLTTVQPGQFAVALIPTTLEATTLGERRVGGKVNIETDVIGKYVLKQIRLLSSEDASGGPASTAGVTMDKLRNAGFL
jgi:riboflavin synthase